ncbi:MAG: hypothetical protein ACR2M1_10770 [Gemmatimonadaceae bacterium]
MRFARDATEASFAAREVIAGNDARALATEILAMDDDAFRIAFKKSPMKRAKRSGLRRNAAVVLENVAEGDDISMLAAAFADPNQLLPQARSVCVDTATESDLN